MISPKNIFLDCWLKKEEVKDKAICILYNGQPLSSYFTEQLREIVGFCESFFLD